MEERREDRCTAILNDLKASLISELYELKRFSQDGMFYRKLNEDKLAVLIEIIKAELHADGYDTYTVDESYVDNLNKRAEEKGGAECE